MKKFLLVVLGVVLCLAAGVGIFIATFDADRYRSTVVQKMSEALGQPVELGRLSLVWKRGLALRVQNLAAYTDETKKTKSLLVTDGSVVVRLMPLLNKEIQVASISLVQPSVRLVRDASGAVRLAGSKISAGAPAAPAAGAKGADASSSMLLSVGSFVMQDGRVDFADESPANPFFVSVRDIDVKVKNFSLTKPFSFDAAAALFSAKQNVHVNGVLKLPSAGDGGYLEKMSFQTGLADWDLPALSRAVPAVRAAGLEGNVGGKLELRCERLDLDPARMKSAKASVKLQNGAFKLASMKSAFERVQLAADVAGGNADIDDFSANFAGGTLKASGTVKQFTTQPLSDVKLSASDLVIDRLMSEGAGNSPKLGGHVSLEFAGGAAGNSWPQISQTLSGQGRFTMKDGVLFNYNMLREVIQKISIIPGAEGVLQERLPNIYKAKMGEPSTIFQPIDLPFTVQNGVIVMNRLTLVTDVLLLDGAGQVGLDKSVDARLNLHLHRDLSAAIVGLLPQAQAIVNVQGEIEIPMQVQGVLPYVVPLPDKEFLTQRLIGSAVQQLVASQARNLLDKPAEAGQAGENTVQNLLSSEDGLKNLFKQAVGQADPGSQQQ